MLRNFWGEAVLQWFIVCSLMLINLNSCVDLRWPQRPLACVRSRSVDSQALPTCSSFGAALRQSISTFPKGLDSPELAILDLSQRPRFALRANLRLVVATLRYGCLLRSRSCRPTGCLRQATQPAPAGRCSYLLILKILQSCLEKESGLTPAA
jgi:hypothetical protein